MIRVRICTSRCRCHSSCRRSRFSALGTQIRGKRSSNNSFRSSLASSGLRLPDPLGFDLGGIADPQLEIKFSQQSLEPARIPGSLHAYPHADSLRFQISIEVARFSVAVVQSSFTTLTSLFNQKCNLLKARVIIYSYNHHVRLLPPERLVVNQSILGSREPTLLCHHLIWAITPSVN